MQQNERTETSSMTNEDEQDLLIHGDEVDTSDEQEVESSKPAARDEIDELLDDDPEVRNAVKNEMKRRLIEQQQAPQRREPQKREPSEMDKVREEIEENDAALDAFFNQAEDERDYVEYEKRKLRQQRLIRRESLLKDQRYEQQRAASRAPSVVENWIRERAGTDREILQYADRIKSYAQNLKPEIKADEAALRNYLQYMVEPNAYKEYMRSGGKQRKQPRRDEPSGDAYMDDDGEPRRKGKYADASDEERDFLRRVGVLKDSNAQKKNTDLYPTEDKQGFYVPVGRGRRNEQGGQ